MRRKVLSRQHIEKKFGQTDIWLDVGCGENKQDKCIGMDVRDIPGVDVVHDIEVVPWPFEKDTFTHVVMSHIVEHLKPWLIMGIIDEVWRITKVNGILLMAMPYPNSIGHWQDPTHIRPWNEHTPKYFDPDIPDLYEIYKPKPWKTDRIAWQNNGNIEIALRKRPETYVSIQNLQTKKADDDAQTEKFERNIGARK